MVTSASSLELIGAWRASRLPITRFLPLAALLAWAASVSSGADAIKVPQFLLSGVLGLTLIAQFRLWDDLADRVRDRHAHPERLLASTASSAPFAVAIVVLGAINAIGLGLLNGWPHTVGFLLLNVLAGLWYRSYRARGLVHTHVLLLKYPAFVLLLAFAPVDRAMLALAATAIYAALCLFELLDDPGLRGPAGGPLLIMHSMVLMLGPVVAADMIFALAASLAIGVLLITAWRRCRSGAATGPWCYLPFFAASLTLAFITLRGFP